MNVEYFTMMETQRRNGKRFEGGVKMKTLSFKYLRGRWAGAYLRCQLNDLGLRSSRTKIWVLVQSWKSLSNSPNHGK